MNPQDISNRKFEKSTFGYKPEEVDEYLRDIAIAYAKEVKDKEENELKIVKLVEKINEYRSDEDAIRDALLVAQKEGNRIIAEAKAEAERILSDAQTKHDSMIAAIQDDCDAKRREETEKVTAAIKLENEKLAAVRAAAKTQRELQGEKLQTLRKEVSDFKKNLISILDDQVRLAISLPELTDEQIENILASEPDASEAAEALAAEPAKEIAEEPKPEEKHEEKHEPKRDHDQNGFSFQGFKRQNYSADELKFGQNNHN